jgi:BA14K-like protein
MFPSLSDRTKTFIAASAVAVVAVCNVVFGMNWVAERPAVRPLAAVTGVAEPPPVATPPVQSPPVEAARPPPPAASPPLKGKPAAAPKTAAPQPAAAPITSQPDPARTIMNEPAAPAAAAAPPQCDIAACAAAYHSFTASDCTYMPSAGVRRLCTKGTPPQ